MKEYNFDDEYTLSPWLAAIATVLFCGLLILSGCAADGTLANSTKPLDKNQTRLAMCEGAQKIDIAFQTIAKNAPGVIPANVMSSEGSFIDTVGFTPGSALAARDGSVCAVVYVGDLDVAINTAIIAVTNISVLIKKLATLMDWVKLAANLASLFDRWSKYFQSKSDQETGAKLQQGATDAATLARVEDINSPIGAAESNELWQRNKEKYGQPAVTGECNGE